jgi:Fe2+ transport system protein FeoA
MATIKEGRCCRVCGIGKGRGFRTKMMAMGVRPGALLRIISGYGSGPRLIELGRQRIMIGSEMLSHIYVHEEGKTT